MALQVGDVWKTSKRETMWKLLSIPPPKIFTMHLFFKWVPHVLKKHSRIIDDVCDQEVPQSYPQVWY
jgi:hypothetical protein